MMQAERDYLTLSAAAAAADSADHRVQLQINMTITR